MGRLIRIIASAAIVTITLLFCANTSHSQGLARIKDWKDINILPTNSGSTNNIRITLSTGKDSLNPGDELKLSFSADRECYLTLMDMGTSGRILRIWPNDYSGSDNKIEANVTRNFPATGDKFRFRIAGPSGTERIIAYATSEKGKILSEQEFQQIQKTGFKEYRGNAKDLAIRFQRNAETVGQNVNWGTAQLNITIGSEPPPAPPIVEKSKTYLLAISGHGVWDDRPQDNTVVRIAEIFQAKAGIENSNLKVLRDAAADFPGSVSGLKWLASVTQPEDTAIIYFSGHGGNVRGEGFLVLYPGQKLAATPQFRGKKHLLSKKELTKLINKIPARKKILIVDSCHSRAMAKHFQITDPELISDYIALEGADEEFPVTEKSAVPDYDNDNLAFIASALKHETSYSHPKLQGGVLTYFLVEAIKQGSQDLEAAFNLAKENVADWYDKRKRHIPNPPTPCLVDPNGIVKEFRFRN